MHKYEPYVLLIHCIGDDLSLVSNHKS